MDEDNNFLAELTSQVHVQNIKTANQYAKFNYVLLVYRLLLNSIKAREL